MATLDIRDFGANVDGSTDDTAAVMDAIGAASSGDTVYFPAGTTMVYTSGGSAIGLDDSIPDDLTLAGAGESSVLKMAPRTSDGNAWIIGVDGNDSPISGLTIHDLVLDGNRANNPPFTSMGFNLYPGGSGHDVTIRNVRTQNCSETGFVIWGGTVKVQNCTAINNGRHGFGLHPVVDTEDPEVILEDVLALDNGGLGIDHNSGVALVNGFWAENNDQGGAKVPWPTKESTWRNGTFKENGTMGFRFNGDYRDQDYRPFTIHLDNVVAVDNPWSGFWLAGDVDYDIGTIAAVRNNTSGQQHGNIDVHTFADLDAEAVYSSDANGSGLFYSSSRNSRIANYHYANNRDGAFSGDEVSNLTVDNDSTTIPSLGVPAKDEVGAWATSNPIGAILSSSGGSVQSAGGALEVD